MSPLSASGESLKIQYIQHDVLPAFGLSGDQILTHKFARICRLHDVIKHQLLENPGAHNEGKMWFSIQAMVHSYYYDRRKNCRIGTRIWKKKALIFDNAGLLHQRFRADYMEALEPGEVISIRYTELLDLMIQYPEIEKRIQYFSANNEQDYRYRIQLLNKSPLQRVKEFEAGNSLFARVASNSIKAIHVGLTRQGYELQLKKIAGKR